MVSTSSNLLPFTSIFTSGNYKKPRVARSEDYTGCCIGGISLWLRNFAQVETSAPVDPDDHFTGRLWTIALLRLHRNCKWYSLFTLWPSEANSWCIRPSWLKKAPATFCLISNLALLRPSLTQRSHSKTVHGILSERYFNHILCFSANFS
jgi:hypothetical protein